MNAVVVASAAMMAVLLNACTSQDASAPDAEKSSTAPTSAPPPVTVTTSASDPDREKALAAYRAMWVDFAKASETSNYRLPLLAKHATGGALRQMSRGLYQDKKNKVVSHGAPRLHPVAGAVSVRSGVSRVVFRDCVDTRNWLQYTLSGHLVDNTPGGDRRVNSDVRSLGGHWTVVDFNIRPLGTC